MERRRRSIRLRSWDYRESAAYFVTICAAGRRLQFGTIEGSNVCLSRLGRIVAEEWARTPELRPDVELCEFVVMPNHFHAVLILQTVGANCCSPLPRRFAGQGSGSLAAIIAGFKSATTARINRIRGTPERPVWQRNYYERVLREHEFERAREYVLDNPPRWPEDPNNPANRRTA